MELSDALALYRDGRLSEAETLCREVLRDDPGNFGALHLGGIIALRVGRSGEAADRLTRATVARPESVEVRNNLAAALRMLGRMDEALACFDAAIALRPDHAESHFNRATHLREVGRAGDALDSYDAALAMSPDFAVAHLGRGMALREAGDRAAALAAIDRAIAIDTRPAEAWFQRGNVLRDLDRRDEAAVAYERAIARRPDHALALNNRGVLADESAPGEALSWYDRAIAAQPDLAVAHSNRGRILRALGRWTEALESYDRAVALKPDFVGALVDRGNVLRDLNRPDEAMASYSRAATIDPMHADSICGMGNVLGEKGDIEAALVQYERAVALDPASVAAQYNKGACHLALGDYMRGWHGFEWRRKSPRSRTFDDLSDNPWLGESPIDGKTILVRAEAGFGDMLQLCRYVPRLARTASVDVQVQRPLVRLFGSLPGVARVIAADEPAGAHDAWVPMMSLPLAFRSTLETTPADVPYLSADPARAAAWRQWLDASPGRKVGLVWAGSPLRGSPVGERMNGRRSVTLRDCAPLASVPGVTFVSLQKDDAAAEVAMPPFGMALLDRAKELMDFADTADLIAALDLVISVDTAVAHLAGALAKPVWILNRYDQCWRWLRGRNDSPWYPTARLFRQRVPEDWPWVIDEVEQALRDWVSGAGG